MSPSSTASPGATTTFHTFATISAWTSIRPSSAAGRAPPGATAARGPSPGSATSRPCIRRSWRPPRPGRRSTTPSRRTAGRSCPRTRPGRSRPATPTAATIIHCSRLTAMTPHVEPSGTTLDMCARFRAVALIPPSTPWISENWIGRVITPMSMQRRDRSRRGRRRSTRTRASRRPRSSAASRNTMSSKWFSNTKLKTNAFRFDAVLRVVHRAHVQRADLGLQVGDVARRARPSGRPTQPVE